MGSLQSLLIRTARGKKDSITMYRFESTIVISPRCQIVEQCHALLEFGSLPSAKCFVECFSGTRQRVLCRVPSKRPSVKENTWRRSSLPSVLFLTLGKEFLCRVFFNTVQRASLPSVKNITFGKELLCPMFFSTLFKDNLKIIF
jgi:hypothetical protein